ncbi:glucan endo-1,3-beta-glucosidase 13-like [Dorcoceras hygrometricum]|uniref:Glucan endo-1,3-beta-glucosidase 13-like n=1 Tax=Dorcoceras hygrometricum TaxID=472368 RepID=A0A2Z7AR69_9LAMI|nr:glucan endo-1,3-beta-glucosidase 13-like [Dorcoceras hygrometricum]
MTIFSFLFLLPFLRYALCDPGTVGVNYGRIADNFPPPPPQPPQVVKLLQGHGFTQVKLYDTDSTVLSALSGSGISVIVALPNEQLSSAASGESFTDSWVQSNILAYHPKTQIVAIGHCCWQLSFFVDPQNTTGFLVPAMKTCTLSLVKYGVDSSIKVSSRSHSVRCRIRTLHPLVSQIGLGADYALFRDNPGVTDPNNGLVYKSLFEAQLDAVFAAMNALGFNDIKVVVSETGWPSKGDENEIVASKPNAAAYNGNLVRRVLTGGGTPLRPDEPLDVYLFALFNEDQKTGSTSEKNYGLFYPNEEKVYDIPLTLGIHNESKSQVKAKPPTPSSGGDTGDLSTSTVGQTWCVANEQAGEKRLQAGEKRPASLLMSIYTQYFLSFLPLYFTR